MKNLGIGVMINMLGGNEETVNAVKASLNKKIKHVELLDEQLNISFEDGSKLTLWDAGQSCCESRYMRTDDDLNYFIGSEFLGGEIKDAPGIDCSYGDHEVQFLEIKTNKGSFVMSSHNEHNGYYGGFYITASL